MTDITSHDKSRLKTGDWAIRIYTFSTNVVVDIIRFHKIANLYVGSKLNPYIVFYELYKIDYTTREVFDQVVKSKSFVENLRDADIVMFHPECIIKAYNDNVSVQLRKATEEELKKYLPVVIEHRYKDSMYASMCKFIINRASNIDFHKPKLLKPKQTTVFVQPICDIELTDEELGLYF